MMAQPDETTDMLIARCLQGDQAGYAQLYELYAPAIYRLCYSLLLNRQDAEDVMQEAFVYAFRCLHRYDPARASFKTWLYTIALSRCRNVYRRKHSLLSLLLAPDVPAPKSDGPEAALSKKDAQAALEAALKSLSPPLRESVILRYGHGLTYREMAAVIGCPQKTAESRVRLAHDRLRKLLQAEWIVEEWIGFEVV
ncbi:MAG: RNA polymerase sigma factor [Chloroflexi bacterium]|jgi:RNA polymerase sigma-70 factor (ECF subfamily)|nr:RNA polymerase sigma factor [Chloroflexota bacterium]MDL1882138.1 RNA polymerase sigma factor [Anaerolineae bacterium CFX8]GIL12943.1 MAG: sigma-24 [Chloroflexota bacterium]